MYMFMHMCRVYQLGSPVVSLSISCTSENCEKALRDGVQITIVHNTTQVYLYLAFSVLDINICSIAIDHVMSRFVVVDSL